jgi:hypothetical protein
MMIQSDINNTLVRFTPSLFRQGLCPYNPTYLFWLEPEKDKQKEFKTAPTSFKKLRQKRITRPNSLLRASEAQTRASLHPLLPCFLTHRTRSGLYRTDVNNERRENEPK